MPVRVLTFTETVAGATYTATGSLPKGARLYDVLIETTVAWTAATADLDLGDSDGNDSLAAAVDLTNQLGVTGANAGGTDWGNGLTDADGPYSAPGPGKLYPVASPITAVVTAGAPGGPTGASRITLFYDFAGPTRAASVV